jgi:hypothetical protein
MPIVQRRPPACLKSGYAISVQTPTSLLVFSSVFGVVPAVAWFDYAPIATP